MNGVEKPTVWLHGEIKSPPFSENARIEAGTSLRRLQERFGLPWIRKQNNKYGPEARRCRVLRRRHAIDPTAPAAFEGT